jgi:hypothetical protein
MITFYTFLFSLFCILYNFRHHTQSPVDHFKSIVRQQVTTLWNTVDTDGDGHFEAADMHHIFDDYDGNRKYLYFKTHSCEDPS